jgi:hypothetical protein
MPRPFRSLGLRLALPALVSAGGCASATTGGAPSPADVSAGGAAFAPAALEARLTAFAHDSMLGRQAGAESGRKAARFLADAAQRLGLRPMGDRGTFLQEVPFVRRAVAPGASITIGDATFEPYTDFAFFDAAPTTRSVNGATVIYAGPLTDPVSADSAAGRVVAVTLTPTTTTASLLQLVRGPLARAAGIVLLDVYAASPAQAAARRAGTLALPATDTTTGPLVLALGARMSRALVPAGATPARGQRLGTLRGDARLQSTPSPAHNVVAVIPGSDPALAGQYVAFGAHLDHVGVTAAPVDHDSLRAFNSVVRPGGADDAPRAATEAELPRIRAVLDSLRRIRPARLDSVFNGADDDASGSIGVLAVAEAFATARVKPRRSLLFVWHTAEEAGLIGANWFTEHPTVPLDSIVTQLNVDMIGRGMATDLPKGGPGYVQLIGSKRLSTQLGALVETVNAQQPAPFTFDYEYDANGHPQQYYCRSDHYMYARFGIPVTFFSTGGHRDYHMLTDEVQYIDFTKLGRVSRLIHDVGLAVANLPQRPVVDGPKPEPNGTCRQ